MAFFPEPSHAAIVIISLASALALNCVLLALIPALEKVMKEVVSALTNLKANWEEGLRT